VYQIFAAYDDGAFWNFIVNVVASQPNRFRVVDDPHASRRRFVHSSTALSHATSCSTICWRLASIPSIFGH
jgi:hypothetical protein